MSLVEELEQTLPGAASHAAVRAAARRHRDMLNRLLPNISLSVPSALYIVQRAQCFHCQGFMPLFWPTNSHQAATREHVLPKDTGPLWTYGVTHMRAAVLLAHKLCNAERGQRPFNRQEWRRAFDTWNAADSLWLEAGKGSSPFVIWLDLCHRMLQETP